MSLKNLSDKFSDFFLNSSLLTLYSTVKYLIFFTCCFSIKPLCPFPFQGGDDREWTDETPKLLSFYRYIWCLAFTCMPTKKFEKMLLGIYQALRVRSNVFQSMTFTCKQWIALFVINVSNVWAPMLHCTHCIYVKMHAFN